MAHKKAIERRDNLKNQKRRLQQQLTRALVTIKKNQTHYETSLKELESKKKKEKEQALIKQSNDLVVRTTKKYMLTRAVQTNKKVDPFALMDNLKKRNQDLVKSLGSTSGKLGVTKKEVIRLQAKLQAQETQHAATVNKLTEKIAELQQGGSGRREDPAYDALARQLQQTRGNRDANAFSGFLQYMNEPVQEFQ